MVKLFWDKLPNKQVCLRHCCMLYNCHDASNQPMICLKACCTAQDWAAAVAGQRQPIVKLIWDELPNKQMHLMYCCMFSTSVSGPQ